MAFHRWEAIIIIERPSHRGMASVTHLEEGRCRIREMERLPQLTGVGPEELLGAALLPYADGPVLYEWGEWQRLDAPPRAGSEHYHPKIDGTYAHSIGVRRRYWSRLARLGLKPKSFRLALDDQDRFPPVPDREV